QRIESLAYGRVLDIRPLLELRSRYRSAQSELAIAEAALRVAEKSHQRLETLHRESIIATRDLIQAESQLATDRARQVAAVRHIREVREEALQSWGEGLYKRVVEAESSLLQNLLNHTRVLVLIALPARQSLHEKFAAVTVAPSGEPDKASQGRMISPAPKTEESTQGETWFFEVSANGLRTGMRLDAWIPEPGHASVGVLIPFSAVIWHEGRPWVFVQTGYDGFSRRPLGHYHEQGDHWFVTEGFSAGERVVIVGGQMLLSEQQRQIAPKGEEGKDD
ncbi:MAG: efflux RND transporter periplasmic adaptor subunit, partial [Candidatus Methylumidiphilus sp.]